MGYFTSIKKHVLRNASRGLTDRGLLYFLLCVVKEWGMGYFTSIKEHVLGNASRGLTDRALL